jgi:FAD/FMN-containing dehydrogenase
VPAPPPPPPEPPAPEPPPPLRRHRRRRLRRAVGLAVGGLLSGWAVHQGYEEAAAPDGEKTCDFVFPPPSPAGAAAAAAAVRVPSRLAPTTAAPSPPAGQLALAQQGGTVNDASCLNKTAVYGVVRVKSRDDVARALAFARAHGLQVTAAGERHSMGGQSFVRHGLVLDMRGLDRLSLDRERRLLTVESGARWVDVQRFLDARGCAVKAMQSINVFSIGGSLSVNGHGIAHDPGPVATTVRSLAVMTADGQVRNASRDENPDLFRAALGGYGLVGVILEARLEVVPNVMYERHIAYVDYRRLPELYDRQVAGRRDVGLFYARLSIAPGGSYLRETAVHTYTAAAFAGAPPPLGADEPVAPVRLIFNLSKRGPAGRYLRWMLEKHLLPLAASCTRNQAMGAATDDCLVSRNEEMAESMDFLRNRLPDTDILQEYFVPRRAMPAFTDALREVVTRRGANLLNVTIRHVSRDDTTVLPYARDDRFALVLYFNQRLTAASSRTLDATTCDLIDHALRLGGTYYLPYRLCYSAAQLRAAYPTLDQLWQIKARYDPDTLFTNEMYEKYGPPRGGGGRPQSPTASGRE